MTALSTPLQGIRVLDLSTMLAGPWGAMMLADLGAEVIKIEPPAGDPTRTFDPYFQQGDSLYYLTLNRNKKSVVIDLKEPEGLKVFYDLVRKSDVVWENYRSGVSKRLKIDYESVRQINPAIISCSISAFGEDNPFDGDQPTFDLCIQAMSGALNMTGEPDRPPVKMAAPMADLGGGWYAVVGLLAALVERSRTGLGQKVDIAMLDSLVSLHTYEAVYCMHSGVVPTRLGTSHRSVVPYQIFPTKTIYVAIVATLDKFWVGLCKALGIPQYANDERFATLAARFQNRPQVEELLTNAFLTDTCEAWMPRLKKEGVPSAPVNTLDKALSEPALLHRNMVVEVERGGESLKLLGNPIKLSHNQERFVSPPRLGENSRQVLKELLGYLDQQIDELERKKIIAVHALAKSKTAEP